MSCLTPGCVWKTVIDDKSVKINIDFPLGGLDFDPDQLDEQAHALVEALVSKNFPPHDLGLYVLLPQWPSVPWDGWMLEQGVFLHHTGWCVQVTHWTMYGHPVRCLSFRHRDDSEERNFDLFMDAKNKFLGTHSFAVEVYPSTDLLVDSSNTYHMIEMPFPVGFSTMKRSTEEKHGLDEGPPLQGKLRQSGTDSNG